MTGARPARSGTRAQWASRRSTTTGSGATSSSQKTTIAPRARSRPALRAAAAPLIVRSHTYTSAGRLPAGAASTSACTARRPASVALWSTTISSSRTTVWASTARTVSASRAGRSLVGMTALTLMLAPRIDHCGGPRHGPPHPPTLGRAPAEPWRASGLTQDVSSPPHEEHEAHERHQRDGVDGLAPDDVRQAHGGARAPQLGHDTGARHAR